MGKKVLIIEDDESILEAVKLTLEMEGYNTEIVNVSGNLSFRILGNLNLRSFNHRKDN